MTDKSFRENLNVILLLLDRAEQILSLINLPDSTISKYNQLKELTFDKLNMDFKPLEKSKVNLKSENKKLDNSNSFNNNFVSESMQRLRSISNKKNIIIENVFEMIDKFKLENNSYMRTHLLENFSFNLSKQLERPRNNKFIIY